jgi:threonine/homoserine/homoserine lactone efflux protein
MVSTLIIKGLITGLLVSLPLGPMGILVVQRTANRDLKSGFYTGMGVAFIDSIWSLIAGFSVTYIITFLRDNQSIIQIIGAIALFTLGLYIFISSPINSIRKFRRNESKPIKCFFTTIPIALSNPAAIFIYILIFASINIVFDIHHLGSPLLFTFGFLTGALSWWLTLSFIVNRFRHHLNLRRLWWFNKISGLTIMIIVIVSTITVLIRGNPDI